jgi:hypothetical protein
MVLNPLHTMWTVQRVVNGLGMKNLEQGALTVSRSLLRYSRDCSGFLQHKLFTDR